jgi:hypothetical protein
MIVQETGDPRLQQGGGVRFAQGCVLEEPALNVSRQNTVWASSQKAAQRSGGLPAFIPFK